MAKPQTVRASNKHEKILIKGKTHVVLGTNIYREAETLVLPMRHEDNVGWKTGRRKRA